MAILESFVVYIYFSGLDSNKQDKLSGEKKMCLDLKEIQYEVSDRLKVIYEPTLLFG